MTKATPRRRAHLPAALGLLGGLLLAPATARAADLVVPGYTLLSEEAGEYSLSCRLAAPGGWTDRTEARLAFDVQSAEELAYFRIGGGRVALFLQTGGKTQPIGTPRPFQPAQLSTVCVQRRDSAARLVADGRVLLDVDWKRPLGGRVATFVAGGVEIVEPLLQPYAPPLLRDDFTRETTEMGGWEPHGGTWQNTMVAAPRAEAARSANPFSVRAVAAPEALLTTGSWFWDSYLAGVSVKPLDTTALGLAVYVQDDQSRLQLTWKAGAPDMPHARQLLLIRGGKSTVLAEAAGGYVPGQWYRLELRVRPGRLEAAIDRDPVFSTATEAFGQGGMGLWCAGGEAVFDDALVVGRVSPTLFVPRINPVFLADETMGANQLYLPAGQWRPAEGGGWWNWGEYFGDATVSFPARALTAEPVAVILGAPTADAAGAGAASSVSLKKDGEVISVAVKTASGKTASASIPPGGDDLLLVTGSPQGVTVGSGDRVVVSVADPAAFPGHKLGLSGAAAGLVSVAGVTATHLRDDAFEDAPTDWFAGKGLWQVTTRWPCQPGWTFFGGTHDENPVLWSKHRYEGDMVLEFFANIPMDCPPPPGYSRPSDVDAALCGDGVDLGSGYSFIFAGWKNTRTAILRRGQIVAEATSPIFVDPTSSNFAFHRHWFRVHAEKLGSRVALAIDGTPVLQFQDPDPLPGGRVALFSFHNGLMVGRARLWFAQEAPGGVVAPRAAAPAPEPQVRAPQSPVWNDFESGLVGEWQTFSSPETVELALDGSTSAAGKRSLRLTNAVSGGSFGAYAVVTPFRATEFPKLSFDYRLPPEVKVNLYLYLNDCWHAVVLAADEPGSSSMPLLGRLEGAQADDHWHHAEFDLLAPLQKLYPQLKAFTVKYVALAAPQESYARCGIGGNPRGAHYWVDNLRIGPKD